MGRGIRGNVIAREEFWPSHGEDRTVGHSRAWMVGLFEVERIDGMNRVLGMSIFVFFLLVYPSNPTHPINPHHQNQSNSASRDIASHARIFSTPK
jgi:hypothetical protein